MPRRESSEERQTFLVPKPGLGNEKKNSVFFEYNQYVCRTAEFFLKKNVREKGFTALYKCRGESHCRTKNYNMLILLKTI